MIKRYDLEVHCDDPYLAPRAQGDYVKYEDYERILKALKLVCAARDSYCNEFNPGNKVKAVADWGLINEAWCEADRILKTG